MKWNTITPEQMKRYRKEEDEDWFDDEPPDSMDGIGRMGRAHYGKKKKVKA